MAFTPTPHADTFLDKNALKDEANELLDAVTALHAEASYIGAKRKRDDEAAGESTFAVGAGGGTTQCAH